jgi:hypothetical protein
MKEADIILNLVKRVFKIFTSKGGQYALLLGVLLYLITYINDNTNFLNNIDADLDPDEEEVGVFNTFCKDIVGMHAKKNMQLNKISGYLQSFLKILIMYLIFSGLYTYIIVPYLMNSENCNLNRLYKYGFRYVCFMSFIFPLIYILMGLIPGVNVLQAMLPNITSYSFFSNTGDLATMNGIIFVVVYLLFSCGFVMERNKNVTDIFKFKTFGRPSKLIMTVFYLICMTLYLVYIGLSYYLVNKYSENNCYMLKNLVKLRINPTKDTRDKVYADITSQNNIRTHTFVLIFITFIVFGFYTDIFDSPIEFFSSKSSYIKTVGDSLRCQ